MFREEIKRVQRLSVFKPHLTQKLRKSEFSGKFFAGMMKKTYKSLRFNIESSCASGKNGHTIKNLHQG